MALVQIAQRRNRGSLGATAVKLMVTLINGLQASGKRYGLQTMCEGGGIENVTILEAM